MQKAISSIKFTETLCMSECKDGYWLYDTTRGINLAMRAETKDAAFVEALSYYQKRLKEVENNYSVLKSQVDIFVNQFAEDEDNNN